MPVSLPADGHSTATITVATADPNGNRITDRAPQLVVTGQGKLGEPELDNQNKVWLTSYIADRKPGTAVISVLIDNTIKASASIVLSQPDPNSQLLDSVSALPKAVMTGEQLIFHLVGTTGGQARVSVAGLFNSLPMSETNLGVYQRCSHCLGVHRRKYSPFRGKPIYSRGNPTQYRKPANCGCTHPARRIGSTKKDRYY